MLFSLIVKYLVNNEIKHLVIWYSAYKLEMLNSPLLQERQSFKRAQISLKFAFYTTHSAKLYMHSDISY